MVGLERQSIDCLLAETGGKVFEQGADAGSRFLGSFGEQGVIAAGARFDSGCLQPDRLDWCVQRQPVEFFAQDALEAFVVGGQLRELQLQRGFRLTVQEAQGEAAYAGLPGREPAGERRGEASCGEDEAAGVLYGGGQLQR